jgi:hypothetical protein
MPGGRIYAVQAIPQAGLGKGSMLQSPPLRAWIVFRLGQNGKCRLSIIEAGIVKECRATNGSPDPRALTDELLRISYTGINSRYKLR